MSFFLHEYFPGRKWAGEIGEKENFTICVTLSFQLSARIKRDLSTIYKENCLGLFLPKFLFFFFYGISNIPGDLILISLILINNNYA